MSIINTINAIADTVYYLSMNLLAMLVKFGPAFALVKSLFNHSFAKTLALVAGNGSTLLPIIGLGVCLIGYYVGVNKLFSIFIK